MKLPLLSENLAAWRDSFWSYQGPVSLELDQLRTMGRIMNQMVDQARALERDIADMDAVARDLDLIASGRAGRAAAMPIPGCNVVTFPIVPRESNDGPNRGDAA